MTDADEAEQSTEDADRERDRTVVITVSFEVFGLEAQAIETVDRIVSNLQVELAREVRLDEWQVD